MTTMSTEIVDVTEPGEGIGGSISPPPAGGGDSGSRWGFRTRLSLVKREQWSDPLVEHAAIIGDVYWRECQTGRYFEGFSSLCTGRTFTGANGKPSAMRAMDCENTVIASGPQEVVAKYWGEFDLTELTPTSSGTSVWLHIGSLTQHYYNTIGFDGTPETLAGGLTVRYGPISPSLFQMVYQSPKFHTGGALCSTDPESKGGGDDGAGTAEPEEPTTPNGESCHQIADAQSGEVYGQCCGKTTEEIVNCAMDLLN